MLAPHFSKESPVAHFTANQVTELCHQPDPEAHHCVAEGLAQTEAGRTVLALDEECRYSVHFKAPVTDRRLVHLRAARKEGLWGNRPLTPVPAPGWMQEEPMRVLFSSFQVAQ